MFYSDLIIHNQTESFDLPLRSCKADKLTVDQLPTVPTCDTLFGSANTPQLTKVGCSASLWPDFTYQHNVRFAQSLVGEFLVGIINMHCGNHLDWIFLSCKLIDPIGNAKFWHSPN